MKTLPEDFRTYTQALMGEKLYQRLEHAILEEEAPTSIRINPFKCKDSDGEPVPWCPETGRYLSTRPGFTFDPLLHAGLYYVQEASSMFVDMAIRQYVKEPLSDKLNDKINEIWYGQMTNGDYVLGIFNRNDNSDQVTVDFSTLGIQGTKQIRDLWEHEDEGSGSSITATIPAHGCKIVRLK